MPVALPKSSVDPFGRDGLLSSDERDIIGSWLSAKLLTGARTRSSAIDPPALHTFLVSGISSLRRRYKGWDVKPVDVVWGWIAHEGSRGFRIDNLARNETGGAVIEEWQCSALINGRWVAQGDEVNLFRQRLAVLVRVASRVSFCHVLNDGTIEVRSGGLHQIWGLVKRHYALLDVYYIDIMWLVHLGTFCGCCMRFQQHSRRPHLGWWQQALHDETTMSHYPSAVGEALGMILERYDYA